MGEAKAKPWVNLAAVCGRRPQGDGTPPCSPPAGAVLKPRVSSALCCHHPEHQRPGREHSLRVEVFAIG